MEKTMLFDSKVFAIPFSLNDKARINAFTSRAAEEHIPFTIKVNAKSHEVYFIFNTLFLGQVMELDQKYDKTLH
jgi:hypothetical protein